MSSFVPQIPLPNKHWIFDAQCKIIFIPRPQTSSASAGLSTNEPDNMEISKKIYSSCGKSLIIKKISPNESVTQEVNETFCVKSACHLECVLYRKSPARKPRGKWGLSTAQDQDPGGGGDIAAASDSPGVTLPLSKPDRKMWFF